MILKPARYSKHQTVKAVSNALKAYPAQKCNTPEAFKGLVIEFTVADSLDTRVGSLDEIHTYTPDREGKYQIQCRDGVVRVQASTNGFIIQ